MLETVHYYRESENFRAWIEASGDGGIRVLRRMKFKDLIIVFRDILPKLNKGPSNKAHVTFYISRSLNGKMSDNMIEFFEFCEACMDLELQVVVMN